MEPNSSAARKFARLTFAGILGVTKTSNAMNLPIISTGRPFEFYRHVFFRDRGEDEVLEELADRRIVDVGCGLTPYTPDSMFQACQAAGVDFYGVDPKLAGGLKLGTFDRLKVKATGGLDLDPEAPGEAHRLGCYADDLPFEDHSVDLILSSWALIVWISDESVLARIFREFARVLVPGGQVRVYPMKHWDDHRFTADLSDALDAFEIKQWFRGGVDVLNLPPAYVTQFALRD